jgi:hypothetical protein
MKLSEAMRLGFHLAPPSRPRKWWETVYGSMGGACPELAAALAAGLTYEQVTTAPSMLWRQFPILTMLPALPVPGCECRIFYPNPDVEFMIRHLYDYHLFTREQVADWVENLESSLSGQSAQPTTLKEASRYETV